MNQFHQSVLLKEAIYFLNVRERGLYIDATAGAGGYTFEILKRGGKVLAIDRDSQAIEHIKKKFKIDQNLILVQGNFNQIGQIAHEHGFSKVSGIIFDLGVSSHQLESPQRGFSFRRSGPLDMRMDQSLPITAADIVNNFEKRRLNEIFEKFGQEKLSWPIANTICSARQVKKISSTAELAQLIRGVYRRKGAKSKIDPATKVFQALRIVVNSELINLEEALPQTLKLLEKNGRLVIISFHSLEDAQVKRFFKQRHLKVLLKSPVGPQAQEIAKNPRARSARLRAAQKI